MQSNFKKRLLVKVFTVVGILSVVVLGIFFIARDISRSAEYISATRADLTGRLNAVNQLATLRASRAKAEPLVEKLNLAIPGESGTLVIRGKMEDLARQYNLASTFNFVGSDRSISENLMAIDFRMSIQGDYQSAKNFIEAVKGMPYFISILDIDISGQQSSFNSAINGTIYFNG